MRSRNPWDEVASIYEDVRPSYPDELINQIVDIAKLSASSSLLDIGAGTGKATILFAEKGLRIHCIEPGRNLAGILVKKCLHYPNVSVDVVDFEGWMPNKHEKFDLIFCAQAFEYIDPQVRYEKCHELLKKDGFLALFWYGHENEQWESDIFSSGLFQKPMVFNYHSELASDTETCIKALESDSKFILLDENTKSRIREETRANIDKQGGLVSARFNYQLYLAKKICS